MPRPGGTISHDTLAEYTCEAGYVRTRGHVRGVQVSCDWLRADHVTPALTSDWSVQDGQHRAGAAAVRGRHLRARGRGARQHEAERAAQVQRGLGN